MKIRDVCWLPFYIALCGVPSAVEAGGIMLYEISSADTRLASAGWSSRAQDPSTLFTNPAGMARLSCPQAELGMQAINAHIDFDPNDLTTVPGSKGQASAWLPSGSFFYVQPMNECLTLGFGSLGYFGSDLKYNNHWVGRYDVIHTFLEGFSVVPAAAYRVNDCLSVGLGANVMYGIFRQKSAINNTIDALPDGKLKLHDERLSAGVVAGVLWEISPCTRVGVQYLSPVKLRFRSRAEFKNIGPILEGFLAASGLLDSRVHVNVTVPQNVVLSGYHDLNDCWTVMADAGWQQWSQFQKVTINLPDPEAVSLTVKPKYQDTWHAAFGVEYHYDACLTLSSGLAYDSSAISNKHRTLDFPIGEQWRLGAGARWSYSDNMVFDLCYEFQWSGNLHCTSRGGILTGDVSGSFRDTYVQFLDVNVTWRF